MSKSREKHVNYDNESLTQSTLKDRDVYDLLLKIPAGKVSTYGDLAKALGNPLASRQIGKILGRNPNPIKHRVVMSDGKVAGTSMVAIERENYLNNKEYPSQMKSLRILRRLESILKNNKTTALCYVA
jgi:O-6-methylguanine DNA methyltransferase